MTIQAIARLISKELDDGDNDQLDGIAMLDKLAHVIANKLPDKERTAFLRSCGLY